jgi:hypothetical protein
MARRKVFQTPFCQRGCGRRSTRCEHSGTANILGQRTSWDRALRGNAAAGLTASGQALGLSSHSQPNTNHAGIAAAHRKTCHAVASMSKHRHPLRNFHPLRRLARSKKLSEWPVPSFLVPSWPVPSWHPRGDKPIRLNRPFYQSEIFERGGELASDFRISFISFDFVHIRFGEEEVDRIIVSC